MKTLPTNGQFNFECLHCARQSPSKPIKFKEEGQDFSLIECPACHSLTLARFSEDVTTLFKVSGTV